MQACCSLGDLYDDDEEEEEDDDVIHVLGFLLNHIY